MSDKDYSKYQFPEMAKAFDDLGKVLLEELLRAVNWTLGIVVRGLRRVNR